MRFGPRAADLRVLLLSGPDTDPTTTSWREFLQRNGTPFEDRDADRPLSDADLASESGHGRFCAVVCTVDTATAAALGPALDAYRRRFRTRLVAGYETPQPARGFGPADGRSTAGLSARLTAAGQELLPGLREAVPVDPDSWAQPAKLDDPGRTRSLLQTATGEVLVSTEEFSGLETVRVHLDTAPRSLHGLLLLPALLSWATRGRHLGFTRNWLSVHVDDVFLPNLLADGRSTVRMEPADVVALEEFQRSTGMPLDLAYNGFGAHDGDPLTEVLLARSAEFRWLDHTWSHLDLDRLDAGELGAEIGPNARWARDQQIDVQPGALVTGAHTGLGNPELPGVLRAAGITALAADASRPGFPEDIGGATVVPRHPCNLLTTTATWTHLLEELRGPTGPTDAAGFLRSEADVLLRRVLAGDPLPVFAHQANLSGDRLLLTLLTEVLQRYHRLLPPGNLNHPTMQEVAEELRRRRGWDDAVRTGAVRAETTRGRITVHVADSHDGLEIPLTLDTFRGWTPVSSRTGTTFDTGART